jgi:hypothetical protein
LRSSVIPMVAPVVTSPRFPGPGDTAKTVIAPTVPDPALN